MDFLKELWESRAKEERGETEKFPDIFIWHEQVKKDEFLKKLFDLVCQKIKRYTATIKRRLETLEDFNKEKNEDTKGELEMADRNQRLAHEALVSAINFFVRNCEQKGIQIDIDLEKIKDRDWSREWAIKNASIVEKIIETEKEEHKNELAIKKKNKNKKEKQK